MTENDIVQLVAKRKELVQQVQDQEKQFFETLKKKLSELPSLAVKYGMNKIQVSLTVKDSVTPSSFLSDFGEINLLITDKGNVFIKDFDLEKIPDEDEKKKKDEPKVVNPYILITNENYYKKIKDSRKGESFTDLAAYILAHFTEVKSEVISEIYRVYEVEVTRSQAILNSWSIKNSQVE